MLLLKPNCEWCNVDLPPDSHTARICSYECTFCSDCVEKVLYDVCPNCGGGFMPRPIRPTKEHRVGVSITHQPASTKRAQSPYSLQHIQAFIAPLVNIEHHKR